MSYQLKIDKRSLKQSRFISALARAIQTELINSGMTQQEVAEKLGVDRAVVNKRIRGDANLTSRSIADFAYAFDKDVMVTFVSPNTYEFRNSPLTSSGKSNVHALQSQITNVKQAQSAHHKELSFTMVPQ